ncbi:Sensory/regulatory protein RpfC [bacterium HR40]|nr:Sensory/regulatory protein RpfC [bacterium HR40]
MSAQLAKRLLIVGDPALSRNLMELVLNRLRYRVDCTLDVDDTRAMLAANRYDLIFVALQLPGGSGLEFAKRLRRELRPLRQVPIVVFGDAWDEAAVRRACEEAGLQGYLAKPLSIGRWLGVIRELTMKPRFAPAAERESGQRPLPADMRDRPPVDLARLQAATGEDLQLMVEIGTLYVATARQYLERIENALASGNEVREPAHALKGASRNIGAVTAAMLAEELERKGGDAARLQALREEVERIARYFDVLADAYTVTGR